MSVDLNEGDARMARRAARISRMPLEPPREVRYDDGVLSWKAPASAESVTHFRIYRNTENLLVRELPSGQLFLNDHLIADRLFMSSYNKPFGVESMRLLVPGPIRPTKVDLALDVKGILHILNGGTSADSAEMAAETLNFYPKEYIDELEDRILALEEGGGGVGEHHHHFVTSTPSLIEPHVHDGDTGPAIADEEGP